MTENANAQAHTAEHSPSQLDVGRRQRDEANEAHDQVLAQLAEAQAEITLLGEARHADFGRSATGRGRIRDAIVKAAALITEEVDSQMREALAQTEAQHGA